MKKVLVSSKHSYTILTTHVKYILKHAVYCIG